MRRVIRTSESLKDYTLNAKKKHIFELGEMYINDEDVVFSINHDYSDLFDKAKETIEGFKYSSDRMKNEISKYLPSIAKIFGEAGKRIMVVRKTKDLILAKDALDFYKGKVDPKGVAWVLSSLYNVACYLAYAKLSHNDISLNTCFISPEYHNIALLGGWWYTVPFGEKMSALPTRTLALIPEDTKTGKAGDKRTDLDLIRALGRELLGKGSKAPAPMVDWLESKTSGDGIYDYGLWKDEVLIASFGERKFTPMNLRPDDIYGSIV